MKRSLFKTGLALLLVLGLALLSACSSSPKPASPGPTEEAALPENTEGNLSDDGTPSAGPTEAPTDTPEKDPDWWHDRSIEEILAASEAIPFESCAEKAAALAPDDPGPLYDHGWSGSEEGESSPAFGPTRFSVDGDLIYVSDSGMTGLTDGGQKTMFVYDMAAGTASRVPVNALPYGNMAMIAVDGTMYSCRSREILSTGEFTSFEEGIPQDGTDGSIGSFMTAWDGNISVFSEGSCRVLDPDTCQWSDPVPLDAELHAPFDGYSLVGIFPDGTLCFCFVFPENAGEPDSFINIAVVRTDRQMNVLGYTVMPYSFSELEPYDYSEEVIVGRDGMVYVMACFEKEFAVWKIDLY